MPRAAASKPARRVYVACQSGVTEVDGQTVFFYKDVTRVREGHPLLKGREALFRLDDDLEG